VVGLHGFLSGWLLAYIVSQLRRTWAYSISSGEKD
jgi:hypothetical protein